MPKPPHVIVDSNVFPLNDRCVDTFATVYRDAYIPKPLSPRKTAEERQQEIINNNKSVNIPFLDKDVPLTSDFRDHYKHYGAAYLPENRSKASTTDSQHTDIHFGYEGKQLSTISRDTYKFPDPMPRQKTKEERQEEIGATRTGKAIISSLGYDKPEYVSTLEAGNLGVIAARAAAATSPQKTKTKIVASSSGLLKQPSAAEFAKSVSIKLGYEGPTLTSDYADHYGDHRAGLPASANPYSESNRVHEVDPSNLGGKPEDKQDTSKLTVVGADGELKQIDRVRSSIDVGHDDTDFRSVYMTGNDQGRVWLTKSGGWHTHVDPYVPSIRPKFAANMNHPVALQQQQKQQKQ